MHVFRIVDAYIHVPSGMTSRASTTSQTTDAKCSMNVWRPSEIKENHGWRKRKVAWKNKKMCLRNRSRRMMRTWYQGNWSTENILNWIQSSVLATQKITQSESESDYPPVRCRENQQHKSTFPSEMHSCAWRDPAHKNHERKHKITRLLISQQFA